MKKRTDINKMITERLIERIKQSGSLPWKKPWSSPDLMPCNLISKKNYRGVNAFLLFAMGYESPYWLTLRQVNALGGKVRKGEHSTPVVFWKFFEPDEDEENEKSKRYALLRYYRVFNAAQCEGLKVQNSGVKAPEADRMGYYPCSMLIGYHLDDLPDPARFMAVYTFYQDLTQARNYHSK